MSTPEPRHASLAPRPRLVLLVAVLLAGGAMAVGLVGGLGATRATGAAEPLPQGPAETLQSVLRALGQGDVEAACRSAAPDGVPIVDDEQLRGCAADLRDRLDDVSDATLRAYRRIEVRGATVARTRATVEPHQIEDRPVPLRGQTFTLVVHAGRWYVLV
ncbi:hypothetical protein CLV56_1494 [Mumia flava]|uniref:DUF4878 domain-containing protein n=1 Tax=Mumia flava TaxID=1348852 RepID=A0A0B2BTA0_9ACTN|nr:hypothetical protein [Mumia flava]PJJ57267.1 hypothetical protein CLV56_1494 [Mumia flava]